mgnify:CR=1 FL=1
MSRVMPRVVTAPAPDPARRMILRGPTAGRSARVALADLLDAVARDLADEGWEVWWIARPTSSKGSFEDGLDAVCPLCNANFAGRA